MQSSHLHDNAHTSQQTQPRGSFSVIALSKCENKRDLLH